MPDCISAIDVVDLQFALLRFSIKAEVLLSL